MNLAGLAALGVGVLLLWGSFKNVSPVELVKATLSGKPTSGVPALDPNPGSAQTGNPVPGISNTGTDDYSLGAVKPHVASAALEIGTLFGVKNILGVGNRDGVSDHPYGLALDFMCSTITGGLISAYVVANGRRLKVTYVIWHQRINSVDGRGWKQMADRGSPTANHMDHVHVSFTAV